MPNWKKIALSGSNPEFSSLIVDNSVSAGSISGSFSGSFEGDGSSLTGIDVGEVTLKTDTFTSVTSKQVSHTFGTKDVNVTVYDNNDKLIIPASVTTTDTSTVDITFDTATTGRVVITKGGHIVTGSIQVVSQSTVSDTFTAQTSYTASHTFGTTDVFVQVYDNTDSLIIPQKIKILTTGSIGLDFDTATTGKVIIGKSGHIVSGSAEVSTVAYSNVTSKPALISSSAQIATDISGSFTSTSSSISTRLTTAESELSNTLISSSAQIATDISGSFTATSASIASDIANISTDFVDITNKPTLLSGSAQIASDISGSFTAASASISTRLTTEETNVDNLQSFSSSLSTTIITYTGSFSGDGSNLTGIIAAGTLSSSAQIASDISGSLSATAIAALGSGIVSGSSQINLGSATGTAANATSASYSENAATSSRSVNKNTNSGSICFWQGSSAEYSALGSYDPDTVYFVV